jgi:hypothetical protein
MLLAKEISPFEPAEFWQSPVFTSVTATKSPTKDFIAIQRGDSRYMPK